MKDYNPPLIGLLKEYTSDEIFMNKDRVNKLGEILRNTCESYHIGITIETTKVTSLAITYSVRTEEGTSLKNLNTIKAELELWLASQIEINNSLDYAGIIEISIKNMNRPMIGLRSVVDTLEFREAESPLTIAVGVDIKGVPIYFDLAQAPHLLIAGTTGSGKSVFIDDIITSILYKASPSDVRMILIDPKFVDLRLYNDIPHLLNPVISGQEDSLEAIMWVEDQIMKRYDLFSKCEVKDIKGYNSLESRENEALPRILVIIDEFSDLALSSSKELHQIVDRATRMGRAAGIHLILATQLPVAKIVTPQIKANIPFRASFTVVDSKDSRIILEKTGGERLLGNGDMLMSVIGRDEPIHAQAAYVSETEIRGIVDYVITHN